MKVRELMTPRDRVRFVYPNATLVQAAAAMRDANVGALVVMEGVDPAGIVTDRDMVVRAVALGKDPQRTLVREVMSKGVQVLRPDDEVADLHALMAAKQLRRVLVLEDERLRGIVALADVARRDDPRATGETLREISR
jgi:CBS domain-containing protein